MYKRLEDTQSRGQLHNQHDLTAAMLRIQMTHSDVFKCIGFTIETPGNRTILYLSYIDMQFIGLDWICLTTTQVLQDIVAALHNYMCLRVVLTLQTNYARKFVENCHNIPYVMRSLWVSIAYMYPLLLIRVQTAMVNMSIVIRLSKTWTKS